MKTTRFAYSIVTLSLFVLMIASLGSRFPTPFHGAIPAMAKDDGLGNNDFGQAYVVNVAANGYRWNSSADLFSNQEWLLVNETLDDFFTVNVPDGLYFWAEVNYNQTKYPDLDIDLFLYDGASEQDQIDNSTGAGETEWVGALAEGKGQPVDFYVKVNSSSEGGYTTPGVGNYTLILGIDDVYDFPDVRGKILPSGNHDFDSASEVVEGTYKNLIVADNDTDVYKILLYPGHTLTANVSYTDAAGSKELLFYFYDPSYSSTTPAKISTRYGSADFNRTIVIDSADISSAAYYYFVVNGSGPQFNNYTLKIFDHEDNYEAGLGFLTKWGAMGSGNGQFSYPGSVAVNNSGFIYVADTYNHRIQVFYPNGTFLSKWGSEGNGTGEFKYPMGISVRQDGRVFVADTFNHRFQAFYPNGTFWIERGSQGTEIGNFSYPHGIFIHSETGMLYVADTYNHRIQNVSSVGAPYVNFDAFGSFGSGNGNFSYPTSVTVDDGTYNIYVADTLNHRIQKFANDLSFLTKWGTLGSDPGEFSQPRGIAVDSNNLIHVVDYRNHRLQIFDDVGNFKYQTGDRGSDAGEFIYPSAVAVNKSGQIYVADRFNHRIQAFEFIDSNNNWTKANRITGGNVNIGFTHTYAGLLASKNRPDWYKFHLLEAQSIKLTLKFYHVLNDFDFYLFNGSVAASTFTPLALSNQSASDTEVVGRIRIRHNGTYYLLVTAKDASVSNRLYNLTVEIGGVDDEFEENDEAILPSLLPTADATYELFSLKNDPDYFGIPLLQGDQLTAKIEFNSSLGNLDLYLYAINGDLLNDSVSPGANVEEVSWEAGWTSLFILEIRGINSSFTWVGLEYNLTVTILANDDMFEHNDVWNSPSSIAEGIWENLVIRDGDDDWYQFYLAEGDHVSIEMIIGGSSEAHLQTSLLSTNQQEDPDDEEEEPPQPDVDLSAFVKTGLATGEIEQDLELLARSETSDPVEFIEFTAPSTGIYVIWVEFFVGPNGNYTLLIDIEETDDIYEDNDFLEEATAFTPSEGGATYEDLLIRTLDDDWYKINVKKGYGIYANLSFNNVQGDLNLYLISENNTILAYSNFSDSDLEQFAPYEAPATAWYYIVVTQSTETHNSYDLSIDIGPYEEVVKRHPDIPPIEPPEEEPEEEEDLFTPIVIISATIIGGGMLGGSLFILKKKGKLKIPFKRKGAGDLPFDESG